MLRVRGSQLRPERQFTQVGAELIGAAGPAADAEVIAMAASALIELGVAELSCDLGLPALVPAVSGDADPSLQAKLRQARDRKDAAASTPSTAPMAMPGAQVRRMPQSTAPLRL